MYSNFNVTELKDIRSQAEKTFASIIDDIQSIKSECAKMGEIVISDDSNLGARWNNVSESMGTPIETVEDTFLVVKTLLDSYVESTIENEKKAQAELEVIDENITVLSKDASTLLDGLTALRGIGFGASAIIIPGLAGWDPNIKEVDIKKESSGAGGSGGTVVAKYAPPTAEPDVVVAKYAPPTSDPDIVVAKYAPPTPEPEVMIKYAAPMPEPEVMIKYAAPMPEPEVMIKYAAPMPEPEVMIKYAAPMPEPEVMIKYAPPTPGPVVTKYAPPTPGPVVAKYAPPTLDPDLSNLREGITEIRTGRFLNR